MPLTLVKQKEQNSVGASRLGKLLAKAFWGLGEGVRGLLLQWFYFYVSFLTLRLGSQ